MLLEKNVPLRMCVVCRKKKPKDQLIRIVRQKQTGEIFIDKTQKSDGRGAYLCLDRKCLEQVRKKRGIERSFKCRVNGLIYDDLEKELNYI